MSDETVNPADLTNRQRGHLAELAFMRKAASLGFAVAKPWGEGERYDVIVRVESVCWRVQVKSVLGNTTARHDFRIRTTGSRTKHGPSLYSAAEIDFLVAYIFPKDLWYVFPASFVEKRNAVWVSPGSTRSSFEKYREAWNMMRPSVADRRAASASRQESTAAKAGST
ncbi:MAG TPA: group I intron-associated PD-(D/E)XK endonuclease [Terriglobales bacterium]|nr:group I intron-associated PD-(D/E)XK endonuclease [Terriglobales bacterium]